MSHPLSFRGSKVSQVQSLSIAMIRGPRFCMALSSSSSRAPRLSTATPQSKLQRLKARVQSCVVQSHPLGLGRHDTRRHGQNRFARIDHTRVVDLNGGIATLFGEHQHAGLSAHGTEQSPALLGVLF